MRAIESRDNILNQESEMQDRTDTQRIDGLQKLLGRYANKAVCRWSTTGRGWRLHEHPGSDAKEDVRKAIDAFLDANPEIKS